jgi:hypothetical protein
VTGIENDATGSSNATLSEDTGKFGNSTGTWAKARAAITDTAIVNERNRDLIAERKERLVGKLWQRIVNRFLCIG